MLQVEFELNGSDARVSPLGLPPPKGITDVSPGRTMKWTPAHPSLGLLETVQQRRQRTGFRVSQAWGRTLALHLAVSVALLSLCFL